MIKILSVLVLIFAVMLSPNTIAQKKASLQVKTFDQQLKPLPNIEIAINDLDYFKVGPKGTAIIEIDQSEIPIKAIRVNDEHKEAASWSLSKGTIEIIIRPVSYQVMHVTARFDDGIPLANTRVRFHGAKTMDATSDQFGKFDLPISLYETIHSASQFEIANVVVAGVSTVADQVSVTIERPRPKQLPERETTTVKPVEVKFDVARLDSIKTLSEFYAMFRDISMSDLDEATRRMVDEKFKKLVAQRQDSIRATQPRFIKEISDTSIVFEDIRNLLKQATAEHNTLRTNREEFESKIVIISSKLQRGVANLTSTEKTALMHDIDMLEQLLTDNESQFNKNHSDYREIINTLREKYLEVEQLQNRLSEAERLRQQENREFRQRLLGIGSIVIVFGFLIILLITFSARLRRQAKSLQNANEQIAQINQNLETMVTKRTHALEETNRELDTFLYRASHDLQSPVRSMLGLVQIIDHISREELVEHVQMATYNMSRVINKLVDISEISQEANNIRLTNILETIERARTHHLMMMATPESSLDPESIILKNKQVQFDIDCPEGIEIYTSPSLVDIIITNLIENAIFFGGLKKSDTGLKIEIKASFHDNRLFLSVYDNGIGIPSAARSQIFNMFFTGNEKSRGSGLGLYTVKRCVTALHGEVTFESEEGKYTQFLVIIPSQASTVQ